MSQNSPSDRIRLNKLIADSGVASRRQADHFIEEGKVQVNGKRVYELGIKVDPNQDRITLDGKPLRKAFQKIYLLFNKPPGVLTTMEDPLDRPKISDYLIKVPARVFPVGRLDWDSEGLILLTNDGDFANKVSHPKSEVTKTYLVKLKGQPEQRHLDKLMRGVPIPGGRVAAKLLEKIKIGEQKKGERKSDKYDWYKIVITEGKNRQVREMFAKIGFDVLRLQRIAIGKLRIGALQKGELVYLNDAALERIFSPDLPKAGLGDKSSKSKSNESRPDSTSSTSLASASGSTSRPPRSRRKAPARKRIYEGGKKIKSKI